MSIMSMVNSKCTQIAVYWGNPQEDGYGGKTYDDAVEIPCRWEDKTQILGSVTGSQVLGFQELDRGTIYVIQDLDEEGLLYLGKLDELSQGEIDDPKTIERAHMIKRFEKIPALGSRTDFLRVAYLTQRLSQ